MAALRVNQCLVLVFLLLICGIQYVMFRVMFKSSLPFAKFIGLRGAERGVRATLNNNDANAASNPSQMTDLTDFRYNSVHDLSPAKIAVVLPYLGKTLPSWFDLFALSAMGSSSLVDWYIFITEAPRRVVPSNVHLVRVTRQEMFQRLSRLDSSYGNTSEGRQNLQTYFQYIIDVHPYILVEMKPALGFLFSDYVASYSHWAYADLDLLVGRLHHQITPDLLYKYDIITLSFGDNNRLYMRGQFTLHKNTPSLSNLWRGCDYLSKIGPRLESFFVHKKGWDFHSAEGCYSKVVANTPNISILYLPVQLSDAFRAPLEAKETVVAGTALQRCYQHPVSDAVLSASYSSDVSVENALHSVPAAGAPLERVSPGAEHCSYWIDPRDQVCTKYVAGNATIAIENGQMTTRTESRFATDGCREASIAHFQGGKRGYYHFTTRPPPLSAHAMVITDSGIVPLRLSHPGAKPFSETYTADALLAGRLRMEGAHAAHQKTLFGRDKVTTNEPGGEPVATSYCIDFSEDLKKCTRFLFEHDITVLGAPSSEDEVGAPSSSTVTMIAVGWLHEYVAGVYSQLLNSWAGATVLVLAAGSESELSTSTHITPGVTVLGVNIGQGEAHKDATLRLPDKTLYNIGLDAARSEVVLLMPNNMRFPRSEQHRADLRNMAPLLRRTGPPPAIVIPVVLADANSHFDKCGSDQPQDFKFLTREPEREKTFVFHAQELLMPRTIMLPVMFNKSASPHGGGFVRLPEELNGVGCYELSIIRILAGAGYIPQWPPRDKILHVEVATQMSSARRSVSHLQLPPSTGGAAVEEFAYETDCRCLSSTKSEKAADMINHLNKYFLKAVQLRQFGLQKVFSREPFGRTFDEDQLHDVAV